MVQLPKFEVTERGINPYQAAQALSASRVAMDIQDIPQTVSVVTADFIKDTLSPRMLDAAKYVTPVIENTLPFGGDRYTIRGFQVSHEFIDGTEISGFGGYSMSIPTYNIDRLEVIKGPNAILVPGGNPGGQINPITKAPFGKDATTIGLSLAQYYGNDVNIDVNRTLGTKYQMAFRTVAAYWRNDYYIKNQYRNGYLFAPSFSMQLSPDHKLIIKSEIVENRETNGVGVPIDPSIGSDGYAKIARCLPRNWSFADGTSDTRHRGTQRASAELLSTLSDHITSRLYLMADHVRRYDIGSGGAALSNYGSRNPYTGLWEPGVTWTTSTNSTTGVVTVTKSVDGIPDPSTWVFTRNVGHEDIEYNELHLKNDYAAKFETPLFKSTTLVGYAANSVKVHRKSYPSASRPSVAASALSSITYPAWAYPEITAGSSTSGNGLDLTGLLNELQTFTYQNLSFWKDRIQLSGGVSRYFGDLSRTDTTMTSVVSTLPTMPDYNLTCNATSFGIVVKPVKNVSLFFSRNTTGGTMPDSMSAGSYASTLKLSQGFQKEYGVKTNWLGGRLTASFAYFKIAQQNVSVTNSDYYTLLAQGKVAEAAALPPLYVDETCKGWEFETTYSFNKNLSVVANYSKYKVRQPRTEVRLRGVPDEDWALYTEYKFTDGALKGFGVDVGADYKGDVAGDNATGYTALGVPNQPSFMVKGRTLLNLGFSYKIKQWGFRFMIANLTDEDYILAAGSRSSVIVGDPRNVKGSITYSF